MNNSKLPHVDRNFGSQAENQNLNKSQKLSIAHGRLTTLASILATTVPKSRKGLKSNTKFGIVLPTFTTLPLLSETDYIYGGGLNRSQKYPLTLQI